MANPTSTYDLSVPTATWLSTVYGDATISGVTAVKKVDEGPTLASASETTATSWWADATDDAVIALHTALSRARKTWKGADLAALSGYGSDDGLSVGDYGWPSDATVGAGALYQCASVDGPSGSTWTPVRGSGGYDGTTLAIESGESKSAAPWDAWGFGLSLAGDATLALPATANGGDRIRLLCGEAPTGGVVGRAAITGYGGGGTIYIPGEGLAWPTDPNDPWLELEHDGSKWYLRGGQSATGIKDRPWVDGGSDVTRYDFDQSDATALPTVFDPTTRINATTVYTQHSAVRLALNAVANYSWAGYEIAIPAATGVRITAKLWTSGPVGTYTFLGLGMRDATNKLWMFHRSLYAGAAIMQLSYFSTPTTYNSNTFSQTIYQVQRAVLLRATKGGAGWQFAWSDDDGVSWTPVPYAAAGVAPPGAIGTLTHFVVGHAATHGLAGDIWIDSIVLEESVAALDYFTPAVSA